MNLPDPQQSSAPASTSGPHALRWLTAHCDLTILGCFLLGTLVRAYAFGAVPPGLHQDEASAGYDAFALLNYGIDRNGFHNPVAFVGWGSGMFALVSYAAMPFIALWGLTPIAVRFPFLLAGAASILLIAGLARELHGERTARIAAFLLAICPWPILISRWALDSNLLPFVLLAAVLTAVLSLNRPWWLPVSLALFGLSLYTYGTAYLAVPVFLALTVPYALYHRRWPIKPLVTALVLGGLVALPAVLYVLTNWFKWDSIITPWLSIPRLPGVPRFETVGNFHVWDPQFLFGLAANSLGAARVLLLQDDGLPWNSVPWFGIIYLFSLPLALLGFGVLGRQCLRREFTPAFLLFAWCAASIVLTMFVTPNINRLNVGLVPLIYCTALGVSFVYDRWRVVSVGLLGLYTVSFGAFAWTYFHSYAEEVGKYYRESLLEAIQVAADDPAATICLSENFGFPYIYALFVTREDPREFLRTVQYYNPGAEFQLVKSFGRFRIGLPAIFQPEIDTYVVFDGELWVSPEQFSSEKIGPFVVLRKKK